MPRAYSYLRFSTPEQAKGDSSRRQMALARDYALRNGLDLDEELTFQDLGVSAFRGRNAETGRLGEFLEAVKDGIVPSGSYLLVESLDRISRQAARKALRALENIVEAGITVVTLSDGKAYTADTIDDDPMSLMLALMIFIRSNEESATKSRRLKAAWENKRATADKRPLTARAPAWLELTPERQWKVREDRAAIVRRIYGMATTGIGEHSIAASLNREGIPPFGNGVRSGTHWHRTSVAKILHNPAVSGTLVPYSQEYVNGRKIRTKHNPVEGYYPVIVPQEVQEAVASLKVNAVTPQRGRHASSPIRNILGGLAICEMCRNTMTRVTKGSGSKAGKPFLVCTVAKSGGGCRYRAVPLDEVESAIIANARWLADSGPPMSTMDEIEKQLEAIQAKIQEAEGIRDNFVEEIGRGNSSRAIRIGLGRIERFLEKIQDQNEWTMNRLSAARNASSTRVRSDLVKLVEADDRDPGALNLVLRQMFSQVVVMYGSGYLELWWKIGSRSIIRFLEPETLSKVPEQWRERARSWTNPPIIRDVALPPALREELESHPVTLQRELDRLERHTNFDF